MAVPLKSGGSPRPSQQIGRALSRAEAVTLLGMLLCVSSLFLLWPVPVSGKFIAPALVIDLTRTGGAIDAVRWPVTIGAILCGVVLAFRSSSAIRVQQSFVQALGGVTCLIVALMHFGMMPGPWIDLLGGCLLTLGATDRLAMHLADRT